jgi:hypothetical protein
VDSFELLSKVIHAFSHVNKNDQKCVDTYVNSLEAVAKKLPPKDFTSILTSKFPSSDTTPLKTIANIGNWKAVSLFIEASENDSKLLTECMQSLYTPPKEGSFDFDPLGLAVYRKTIYEISKRLTSEEFELASNSSKKYERSVLDRVARSGDSELIEFLLKKFENSPKMLVKMLQGFDFRRDAKYQRSYTMVVKMITEKLSPEELFSAFTSVSGFLSITPLEDAIRNSEWDSMKLVLDKISKNPKLSLEFDQFMHRLRRQKNI